MAIPDELAIRREAAAEAERVRQAVLEKARQEALKAEQAAAARGQRPQV